jgi:hypothetical protein
MGHPVTGPLPAAEERILRELTVGVRRDLAAMPHVAGTAEVAMWLEREYRHATAQVKARILTEELPPQTVTEQVVCETQRPRWASWWDHIKATYAGRWWAGWWVRRHPPAVLWEDVTQRRTVQVQVRAAWKFPHAPHLPTALGRAVIHTATDVFTFDS